MEKKSKKGIILGMTSLVLVTLILLGLTYAYYRTRIIGNNSTDPSISVTSKTMEVTYADGNAYFTPVSTGVQGEYNVDDSEILIEPGDKFKKEFSVINTGDEEVSYSVILDEMTNEYMRNHDWQVTLTKNGTSVISADDNVYLAVGTHQVLLGSETIAASTTEEPTTDTYVLTVTYKKEESIDQSEDMGMKLTFRVNISEETYTWEDAPSGSLLYALKANQPTGTEETVPGQAQSTENEARILTTEDDYGTSYVYRGNVLNNYVTYSNMCWRIVRVQGDGTIKLVLADGAHPCGTKNGYSAEDDDSAFITKNISYSNNPMNASSALFENSNIPEVLSTWASDFNLDTSKLIEAEWCNDASVANDRSYGLDENGDDIYDKELAGDSWEEFYDFSSSKRLNPKKTAEPTLKCNQRSVELHDKSLEGTFKAIRYKNTLGILSADEVMFAGEFSGSWEDEISKTYLNLNATGLGYWTMTPFDFSEVGLYEWLYFLYEWEEDDVQYKSHNFTYDEVYSYDSAVRPSVVLRSDVLLGTTDYTQNGTINAPYVID